MIRPVSARLAPALLLAVLAGCARPPADGAPPDAGNAVSPAPTGSEAPLGPRAPGEAPTDPPAPEAAEIAGQPLEAVEPRRAIVARIADDRTLAAHEAALRAHFGDALPVPLAAQIAPLAGDRRAVLVYGPPPSPQPIVLVLDAKGEVLWTKDRALAGTRQLATDLVIAPGPNGGVAMLWYDTPTRIAALRRWGARGEVVGDFELAEIDEGCDALSGLYWPGRGWVVAASRLGAARAQLLDENGRRAWGPGGNELPWVSRASAPVSIAVDADTSVMFFQVGDVRREGGKVAADRVLGARFDVLGTATWARPIDLGPAPPGGGRIAAARVDIGKVRVTAGSGTAQIAANVSSVGSILAGPVQRGGE
jgi:hypothetical protein